MQCSEIQNYFADYLKEGLEGSTLTAFSEHLKECPDCHVELEALTDVWVKLGSVPPGEAASADMGIRFRNSIAEYKQKRSSTPIFKRRSVLVAAAALILLVSTVLVRNRFWESRPQAVVETVDGSLYKTWGGVTETMRPGDSIRLGDIVRSDGGEGTVLALTDGSHVEMRAQSELSLEHADDGVRIRLNNGSVIVNAAKQVRGHLYVQTRDVTVSVVGTVFYVNAEETGSRVAVIQGEVRVQQGATSKQLLQGEQMATNPLMETQPLEKEISWSRHAEEHLAMLPQNTTLPSRMEFEVASIKPNMEGFIDIGNGARLLSGRTHCNGIDTRAISNDPIPLPPLGRCSVRNSTLKEIIDFAYGLRFGPVRSKVDQMIVGGPGWANMTAFDIDAKVENSSTTTEQQLTTMLQALLTDRFKLRFHRETRDLSLLVLVQSRDGSKMTVASADEQPAFSMAPTVAGRKVPVATIVNFLSLRLGRVVTDKTGLTGLYDFSLTYRPDEIEFGPNGLTIAPVSTDPAGPSLTTALQEQLGLRLDMQKTSTELVVIDYAEMPGPN